MFLISDLNADPQIELLSWYEEAVKTGMKNPEAMTLATSSKSGTPSARIVLFKGMNQKGLKFFTNYQSRKGKELISNPKAALVFYWPNLDKQVRIEGKIQKLTRAESDQYWHSRPRESQIHATVSPQSQIISGRETLEVLDSKAVEKFQG
jgi:pyridoxamine 5'-phosphate oxidase